MNAITLWLRRTNKDERLIQFAEYATQKTLEKRDAAFGQPKRASGSAESSETPPDLSGGVDDDGDSVDDDPDNSKVSTYRDTPECDDPSGDHSPTE